MSAVLQRIASLANGLSKAELHVLIELAARAESLIASHAIASSRELARKTGLARASVQAAIGSLNRKQLIQSDTGSATESAVHRLICLGAIEDCKGGPDVQPLVARDLGQDGLRTEPRVAQKLSHGGLTAEPPVAQNLSPSGLAAEPGVARELGQGGLIVGSPLDAKSSTYRSRSIERACADSIDFDFDKTIDRLQKSKKVDFDEALFELARNRIASHHAKFARPQNRQAGLPDDAITAQFLAVADWPRLEALLLDLASERKEAGHSYGWYVTVALQRIHGISPERLREMRLRLKSGPSRRGLVPNREAVHRKPPAVLEVEQLKEQIRAFAAARTMR